MQLLEAKVHCEQWPASSLLKAAGLAEFAAGTFPLERMLLDLRDAQVRCARQLTRCACRVDWRPRFPAGPRSGQKAGISYM